MLAWAEY